MLGPFGAALGTRLSRRRFLACALTPILTAIFASSVSASGATVSTLEPAPGLPLSISVNNLYAIGTGPGGDTLITGTDGQPLGQGRVHLGTFTPGFDLQQAIGTWNITNLIDNFQAMAQGSFLTPWGGARMDLCAFGIVLMPPNTDVS